MYIATTPTFTFKLPLDVENINNFVLSFAQNGKVILEKYKDDCECSKNIVKVTLTEEETKLFSYRTNGQIQMRIKLYGGTVFASDVKDFDVYRVFNEEVL